MTPRLATDYAKNYCNRTLIVKVIVENVVTCFFMGHSVEKTKSHVVSADKETTVPSLYSAFAINSN